MRIISRFNDYYDYVANSNVDNKIVYNRHCQTYETKFENQQKSYRLIGPHDPNVLGKLGLPNPVYQIDQIHFCGERYCFVVNDGRVVYDYNEVWALLAAEIRRKGERSFAFDNLRQTLNYHYGSAASSLNADLKAPIVLKHWSGNETVYLTNISLKSIDFVQLFSPEQAFMAIYNFLAPKEIEPDRNPDNMVRYEAKGFDRKLSFRKRK